MPSHYLGAAGEHLVAAHYLFQGQPAYLPVGLTGWVDIVVQTAHGFSRVQVKTTAPLSAPVRIRGLGATNDINPSDRYDTLAVVSGERIWTIPASALGSRNDITIHPDDPSCPFSGYRKD